MFESVVSDRTTVCAFGLIKQTVIKIFLRLFKMRVEHEIEYILVVLITDD